MIASCRAPASIGVTGGLLHRGCGPGLGRRSESSWNSRPRHELAAGPAPPAAVGRERRRRRRAPGTRRRRAGRRPPRRRPSRRARPPPRGRRTGPWRCRRPGRGAHRSPVQRRGADGESSPSPIENEATSIQKLSTSSFDRPMVSAWWPACSMKWASSRAGVDHRLEEVARVDAPAARIAAGGRRFLLLVHVEGGPHRGQSVGVAHGQVADGVERRLVEQRADALVRGAARTCRGTRIVSPRAVRPSAQGAGRRCARRRGGCRGSSPPTWRRQGAARRRTGAGGSRRG